MIPLNPAFAATQRPPVMEARRWLALPNVTEDRVCDQIRDRKSVV